MRVVYLSIIDFEVICQELHTYFKSHNDPVPVFKNSYFDKLESIISIPQRIFDKKDLYRDIYRKAACYFYFINKLHPFSNGNKRISIVATGVFLLYNGLEFTASQDMMYTFAKSIILSNKKQDLEMKEVTTFIKNNTKKTRMNLVRRLVLLMRTKE